MVPDCSDLKQHVTFYFGFSLLHDTKFIIFKGSYTFSTKVRKCKKTISDNH